MKTKKNNKKQQKTHTEKPIAQVALQSTCRVESTIYYFKIISAQGTKLTDRFEKLLEVEPIIEVRY